MALNLGLILRAGDWPSPREYVSSIPSTVHAGHVIALLVRGCTSAPPPTYQGVLSSRIKGSLVKGWSKWDPPHDGRHHLIIHIDFHRALHLSARIQSLRSHSQASSALPAAPSRSKATSDSRKRTRLTSVQAVAGFSALGRGIWYV